MFSTISHPPKKNKKSLKTLIPAFPHQALKRFFKEKSKLRLWNLLKKIGKPKILFKYPKITRKTKSQHFQKNDSVSKEPDAR
jgi:hypothetical protein